MKTPRVETVGARLGKTHTLAAGRRREFVPAGGEVRERELAELRDIAKASELVRAATRRMPRAVHVNEGWLHKYRGWAYGAGFGFQLGLGLTTVVESSAVYLTFTAALLSASVVVGALVGSVFGLTRGATIFLTKATVDYESLTALQARVDRLRPLARRVLLGLGLSLAALLIGLSTQ
jgi:hypothetical protein